MNGRSYVLRMFPFLFFPTHFFRRLQTEIFETFPHDDDVALLEKEALLCRFHKSAPKNEGRKPQILPNAASNSKILCAVTRNVEGQ